MTENSELRDRRFHKSYIGDGVYVAFDGYALILTTEDGMHITNRVYLEPEVWGELERCVDRLKENS